MDTRLLERRMQALTLARACALLGARPTTITKVTGLDRHEIVSLLFSEPGSRKPGQNPSSPEWFFGKACLLDHLDASLFMVMFDRLVGLGVRYPDALVTGYRQYRFMRENLNADTGGEETVNFRLTFDRAFDLTRHTYGIWGVLKPSFMLADCAVCRSRYLTAVSTRADDAVCYFCKLLARFGSNDRIRESFRDCSRLPQSSVIASQLAAIFFLVSDRLLTTTSGLRKPSRSHTGSDRHLADSIRHDQCARPVQDRTEDRTCIVVTRAVTIGSN